MEILKQEKAVICRDKDIVLRTKKALEILAPQLPPKGSSILIKPNLVEPKRKTGGAITRPEIVEGIIQFLGDKNYRIIVGEGSAVPATGLAFLVGGYQYLAGKYRVKLVDLNKGPFEKIITGQDIWPEFEVSKLVLETYLITAAVLKEHPFGVTLSIKNLMGCLRPKGLRANKSYMHPADDKILWAKRMALLYGHLKPKLAIIDGTTAMYGSHLKGLLEQKDLTIVGRDALEVDKEAAKILGHKDVFYYQAIEGRANLFALPSERR